MSNSIVYTIYNSVINDVIDNVKKDFEDSGVDEEVLNILHNIWKEKVKSARVAPWEQNEGILEEPNQIVNGISSTSNPYSQPPQMPQNDSMPKGETAAANLSILATQTIISDNSNGVGRVPPPYLPQVKNGNGNLLPSTTDNITKYGMVYDNQQTEASHNNTVVDQNLSYLQTVGKQQQQQELDMYIEQRIKEKERLIPRTIGESTRDVLSQPPPQQPPQPPQQPPQQPPSQQPTYDLANRESRQTDVFSGEDAINSDLDDTDDEGATEGEDTQNIILCLYDKVTRTKNKWKCQLKDGIMSVNGRDFLFQKGNGDFEF